MLRPNSSCDYDLRRVTEPIWSVNCTFEDKILGIRVKGVMGTNSAKIKEADDNGMFYDSTTGVFVKRDEWSISAEGSNIESVFNIPVWTSSAPSPTSWLCTTVLESKLRECPTVGVHALVLWRYLCRLPTRHSPRRLHGSER
jgi:hypothetical protein